MMLGGETGNRERAGAGASAASTHPNEPGMTRPLRFYYGSFIRL
jgi:hypothetical protein